MSRIAAILTATTFFLAMPAIADGPGCDDTECIADQRAAETDLLDELKRIADELEDLLARVNRAIAKLETDTPAVVTPPPRPPTNRSVRDTLTDLIESSDTITDASGSGISYLWTAKTQPIPTTLTLENMKRSSGEFEDLGSRRGISQASARSEWSSFSYTDYGGWMDHSFFFVASTLTESGNVLHPSQHVSTATYSIGEASGSNPLSGGAIWTGVMAGVNANEDAATYGNLVTGDARLSIDDFTRPAIDVAFTRITDSETGARHSDIRWDDLVLENGAFADDVDDVTGDTLSDPFVVDLTGRQPPPGALTPGQISGQFYGPNHEEVGGVFERGGIVGAFGATRQ